MKFNAKLRLTIKHIPILGKLIKRVITYFKNIEFPGSENYWERRYKTGGTSGPGSYNRLAKYKADVLNQFVKDEGINEVIEFGCGDGNQLSYASYPNYIGLDISKSALVLCIKKYKNDPTKSFFLYNSESFCDKKGIFKAALVLSLDVIYHLVEDKVFYKYITDLFIASRKYVIIYSSDYDSPLSFHIRDRNFTKHVKENVKEYELIEVIKNKYPIDEKDPENTSKADYFIYKRVESSF